MTISTQARRTTLNWTGAETSFAAGFPADKPADVKVTYRPTGGAETTLTPGVHYTVTLNPSSKLATVTPVALPAAPGKLTMVRVTPALVAEVLQDGETFPARVHQALHDRGAMRDAELRDDTTRSLRITTQTEEPGDEFDAGGRRIANHPAPLNDAHLATAGWVKERTAAAQAAVEAARLAAEAAAAAAGEILDEAEGELAGKLAKDENGADIPDPAAFRAAIQAPAIADVVRVLSVTLFGTLAAADAAAVSAGRDLYIPPGVTVSVPGDIVLNARVRIAPGGSIRPAAGKRVTFVQRPVCPATRWADVSVGGLFGGLTSLDAGWFTNKAGTGQDCFADLFFMLASCAPGATVSFPPGVYSLGGTTPLALSYSQQIAGAGRTSTIFEWLGAVRHGFWFNTAGCALRHVGFRAANTDQVATAGIAVDARASRSIVEDYVIDDAFRGVSYANVSGLTIDHSNSKGSINNCFESGLYLRDALEVHVQSVTMGCGYDLYTLTGVTGSFLEGEFVGFSGTPTGGAVIQAGGIRPGGVYRMSTRRETPSAGVTATGQVSGATGTVSAVREMASAGMLALNGASEGNRFSAVATVGGRYGLIAVGAPQSRGSTPAFNDFQSCAFDTARRGSYFENTINHQLSDCWLSSSGGSNVVLQNTRGMTFHGCRSINARLDGFDISATCTGTNISNSRVSNNGAYGVRARGGAAGFLIQGNDFTYSQLAPEPGPAQQAAVYITNGCTNFRIIGNDVRNQVDTRNIIDLSTTDSKNIEENIGYEAPGRSIDVSREGARPGTADQSTTLGPAFNKWTTATATTFDSQYPAATAKALFYPEGQWPANVTVQTSGTGASIFGKGNVSRVDLTKFDVVNSRFYAQDLMLTGLADYGFWFKGSARRFSRMGNTHVRDRDIGVRYSGGAGDNLNNTTFERVKTAIQIDETLGIQASGIEVLGIFDTGILGRGLGELKLSSSRFVGAQKIAILVEGTRRKPSVESYWHAVTATNTARRVWPVLEITDAGGFAKIRLATKIACTIKNRGGMFVEGAAGVSACGTFSISPSTDGTISSIQAGGVELLPAPVAGGADRAALATASIAAINAGTGTHGYTAITSGAFVHIDAPASQGAAANGRTLVVATTGGVSAAPVNHIALEYASPHGLGIGDDAWFDTGAWMSNASYLGWHRIFAVESPTVAIAQQPYYGADVTGAACVVPRINANVAQGRVSYPSSGVTLNKSVVVLAADETSITVNIPFVDLSSIPLAGLNFNLPGFDVRLGAKDVANTSVNDQFFADSNINYIHLESTFNALFADCRLKCQVWLDYRANPAMRSAMIALRDIGRGRDSDNFSTVQIAGSPTGWTRITEISESTSSATGNSRVAMIAPNPALPMINWIPQTIEFGVSEDGIYSKGNTVPLTSSAAIDGVLDVSSVFSDWVSVGGVTTLVSLGTKPNVRKWVTFLSNLTLTHSAGLLLPGGQDIVTRPNDLAFMMNDAAGVTRLFFFRADKGLEATKLEVAGPSTFAGDITQSGTNRALNINGDDGATVTAYRASANASAPRIVASKSRGTTAARAAVAQNDQAGAFVARAFDGATTRDVGALTVQIDAATPSATDLQSRLVTSLVPAGSITLAAATVTTNTQHRPAVDNAMSSGTSATRWTQLYAVTATIGTSDGRYKTDVRPLTDAEIDAAIEIARELGAYQWLDAVDAKGEAARRHLGMTVQRAIAIMTAHGLDPFAWAFICHDRWDEVPETPARDAVIDEDGRVLEDAVPYDPGIRAGDRYSFRMEQLHTFVLVGNLARLDRHDARLATLERQLGIKAPRKARARRRPSSPAQRQSQ